MSTTPPIHVYGKGGPAVVESGGVYGVTRPYGSIRSAPITHASSPPNTVKYAAKLCVGLKV